jgi:catechol 2,3-dioxygenase-like lactoylglutathione lyase family enzyme
MVKLTTLLIFVPLTAAAGLNAVGIPVSDLLASEIFYVKSFGFNFTGLAFDLPSLSERVLKLPGKNPGAALVLMKYKNSTKPPPSGKIVLEVEDVKKAVELVRAYGQGAKVTLEPGSGTLANGATLPTAFIKDLDGNDVEINPINLF